MTIIEAPPPPQAPSRAEPGTEVPSPRAVPAISRRRRRASILAIVVGVILAASSVLWRSAAVPALVKYPTDLDVSLTYAGEFRLFADPDTFAPLDEPLQVPLTVERRLTADGDESGASRVVVEETILQRAGSVLDATQQNVYVMDRRDIVNVADERAFAFDRTNVTDRSGAYRIQLPFGTDATGTYTMYINETASTYGLVGTGETYEREGLTLSTFVVDAPYAPLSDAYLNEIRKAVPLPATMTFDQLKPHLLGAGLDVDALVATLTPVVSREDLQVLLAATAEPIRLEYVLSSAGSVGIDRRTGSEVDVSSVRQTLGVRPAQAQVDVLGDVLAEYSDVPAIARARDVLTGLASEPLPVAEYDYAQTAASVADIASEVKDQRTTIQLAEVWFPAGLLVAGLVVVAVGTVLWVVPMRHRRPSDAFETVSDATS